MEMTVACKDSLHHLHTHLWVTNPLKIPQSLEFRKSGFKYSFDIGGFFKFMRVSNLE